MNYLFLITTTIIVVLGGTGMFGKFFLLLGVVNAVAALGYKLIEKGKIELPKEFLLYCLFLLVLLVHSWFNGQNFVFLWLFLSGGLVWLQVYNFKALFTRYFSVILITLGLVMGGLYFYSLYFLSPKAGLDNLFMAATGTIKHSYLGDLWAVVLTSVFYQLSKKKSNSKILLLITGVYFLAVSYSRSALLAIAAGVVYIFKKSGSQKNLKNISIISIIGIGILFLYSGLSKSLLLSRPYFLEAIVGITRFPFGTGIGNFTMLGTDSNLAHNIVLEVFSGMGFFSVVFIYWLYKIIKVLFTSRNLNIEAVAVFLALLVNFSFVSTYSIPALIWIWFMSLGLIQKE